MLDGLHITNGMDWSPCDKYFYLCDSGSKQIFKYDYDSENGTLGERSIFYSHDSGSGTPDGLCIDTDGCLWVAIWDGWQVIKLNSQGNIIMQIDLPIPRPTSCCFGGEDMSTLFVTSARIRLSTTQLIEAPESGSIFTIRTKSKGVPTREYAG